MDVRNAYFIKLGAKGRWEEDSIQNGKLRIGWEHQSILDIAEERWSHILDQLRIEHGDKKGVATNDLHRLQDFAHSTPEDVWITFHGAKLWWCRVTGTGVEQDATSKFRRASSNWSDQSALGKTLFLNDLPGRLAKTLGFRGTICRLGEQALLHRILEGLPSRLGKALEQAEEAHCALLLEAIRELHWHDFELLVDLLFHDAGWQRVSTLGRTAKAYDLELKEPITGDRYLVQVKSTASNQQVREAVEEFASGGYRKIYFVVHSPQWKGAGPSGLPENVVLLDPSRLANLALAAGLHKWLLDKIV